MVPNGKRQQQKHTSNKSQQRQDVNARPTVNNNQKGNLTMASRALAPILRRSVATSRASSKALKGGAPNMPAFARIPAPSEPLVENHDCLFDDACAPELALDFDCQNVSTSEGIASWFIGMGLFASLFATIKYISDPLATNPAITRAESDDIVISVPHHE